MLMRRVPSSEPNDWSRLLDARRAERAPLLDLIEQNPTRVGLVSVGTAEIAAFASPEMARYDPDARGAPAAREAIARYYGERGLSVAADAIVLVSGTSEAYAHLFRVLCDPGDEVLAPAPGYPLLEPLAALEGVRLGRYRLSYDGRWHLDLDSLERGIGPRTRAVIVIEPNHPTGSWLDPDDRAALERVCSRHGLAIVSDEVFGDFPWPESAHRAPARAPGARLPSLIESRAVPTFTLSGLSKLCGMPQMKLGWIVVGGPDQERDQALRDLEWIADLFLSVSTPVQLALPRLLEARHAFGAAVRERLQVNLGRVEAMVRARPELTVFRAAGGWVASLRLPATRTEDEWALELLRRDVVVHPGHFYDFAEAPVIVVSLITLPETFGAGCDRLEALLADSPGA
jgi:aspartate/methionine/tyrosine aminotransferase